MTEILKVIFQDSPRKMLENPKLKTSTYFYIISFRTTELIFLYNIIFV